MNKKVFWFLVVFFIYRSDGVVNKGPKILHMSFHKGCINDFAEVARELGVSLTSWFILESVDSRALFDKESSGNSIYNITHERAHRIWETHKEYFNSFDAILTSDTAPLSRIFLQNGWQKPLIIWVCNRFDYYDGASLDGDFPDSEYYALVAAAVHSPNIKIISYTPYEYVYASKKGVEIGQFTIKPLGSACGQVTESAIPDSIVKNETLFIPPRLTEEQKEFLLKQCEEQGIKVYCGNYNGPGDIKEFKAVLHFPYAFSNLALFENMHNGLFHFVPSLEWVDSLLVQREPICSIGIDAPWAEWYIKENKDLFVYFDSWEDLKNKVEMVDYNAKKEAILKFLRQHKKETLDGWKEVFIDLNLL